MDVQQAVILAGGKGTRLMPLTQDIPKPMVQVGGQPFLYWQVCYLRDQGVREILLLTSYLHEKIESHFQKNPVEGLSIRYSVEAEPLGTGGAVRHALPHLRESFWLINGDSFLDMDLSPVESLVAREGWDACLVTAPKGLVDVPGNVRVVKSLVKLYKKSALDRDGLDDVDAGVYLLKRSVIENGPTGIFDMGDYWPRLIERDTLGAYGVREKYFDIGTIERLKVFEEYVAERFR